MAINKESILMRSAKWLSRVLLQLKVSIINKVLYIIDYFSIY